MAVFPGDAKPERSDEMSLPTLHQPSLQLGQYLRENSQIELSLRLCVQTLGTALQCTHRAGQVSVHWVQTLDTRQVYTQ